MDVLFDESKFPYKANLPTQCFLTSTTPPIAPPLSILQPLPSLTPSHPPPVISAPHLTLPFFHFLTRFTINISFTSPSTQTCHQSPISSSLPSSAISLPPQVPPPSKRKFKSSSTFIPCKLAPNQASLNPNDPHPFTSPTLNPLQ